MSLEVEYQTVRIRKLVRPPEACDDWGLNRRPPRIGDLGTLIHRLQAQGLETRYVVENCDADGIPIWMCDLTEEEIEVAPAGAGARAISEARPEE